MKRRLRRRYGHGHFVPPPGPYTTQAVLAGAYSGKNPSLKYILTHTVAASGTPLCKRVRAESMAGSYGTAEDTAAPTCPICLRRDPRFAP